MSDRPIRALLARVEGGPRAGQPGLLIADRGVGKTAVLVAAALDALVHGKRVLHVSLGDSVAVVRAWYDEHMSALGLEQATALELERRRMVLSYAERPFDPTHLGAQIQLLTDVAQFRADLLVLDGLGADTYLAHGETLCRMSQELDLPSWFAVLSEGAVVRSVGAARFVVRLTSEGGAMRLVLARDGEEEELPWVLDATTQLLRDEEGDGAPEAEPAPAPAASAVTLYSGGASGTEAAFGEAAARAGCREVNFTFDGHKPARVEGQKLLSPAELESGDVSIIYVSRRLNRKYNETGLIRKVLQTLWHMVSRSDQVFVVGAIQEDGTVVGGTGWSVELARMWSKDLWVFDQEQRGWFRWAGAAWVPGEPVITSTTLCGTGTRDLTDDGRAAIDALFARSFA
jgi:hypothetical protein